MDRACNWIVVVVLFLCAVASFAQSVESAMTSHRWTVSERNFKFPQPDGVANNGEFVDFMGRRALKLSRGLIYASDIDFQNGTIDFDMASDANGRFFGIAFHIQSDDNYEVIFFRPGASGTDQAIQYTPGLLGANVWQIYTGPGFIAEANIPRQQWIHVRLAIAGLAAKLYLNNATEPALTVPDLKLGAAKGSIGFWGHSGDAYFTNFTYTADHTDYPSGAEPKVLPGAITDWQLSDIFDADKKDPAAYPDVRSLKWEKVAAENPGMVVINRYRRSPNILPADRDVQIRGRVPGSQFVFARSIIHSDREELRKMYLGYANEVVVFLNGRPLYSGSNTYNFREPRSLGLMQSDSDAVYLPLKKGDNELMLAVTEYFGGWGFLCRFAQ